MKKFNLNLIAALALASGTAFAQNYSCGNNNSKVLVCHIPPGNPLNANTICISANGVHAHVPGENSHRDFLGDCWAGCTGMSVESYQQGKQKDYTDVPADRSDPSKVTGEPDMVNAPGVFFTLGFGGNIVVKMNGGILNRPGNDLKIYETTFNYSCATYPEYARIFVSQDKVSWTDVGVICGDGEVDIAPLDWILYVKIVDESKREDFAMTAGVDGYDVDGIKCIPYTPSARMAVETNPAGIYPNPADEGIAIDISNAEIGKQLNLVVTDRVGREVKTMELLPNGSDSHVHFDLKGLEPGIYFIKVTGEAFSQTHKIIKK